MTNRLTESQTRNLTRLQEIGGTWEYTVTSRTLPPRRDMRFRWERKQGYRATYSEKGSHKGFHRTAMDSLVDMGLVEFSSKTTGTLTNPETGKREIGCESITVFTYTLPTPKATKAPRSSWATRLQAVLTGEEVITLSAATMATLGWPASASKHRAYWGANPAGKAARAAGYTPSLRKVDGAMALVLTRQG